MTSWHTGPYAEPNTGPDPDEPADLAGGTLLEPDDIPEFAWHTTPGARSAEPRGIVLITTAVLALCTALAGWAGGNAIAVTLSAMCLVMAMGWPRLLQLPDESSAVWVVGFAGFACCATVGLTASFNRDHPPLGFLPLAFAFSLFLALLRELGRGGGRPRLVESVTGTVAGQAVIASCASLIALTVNPATAIGVPISMAAVAAGTVVEAIGIWRRVRYLPVLATLAGGLGGWAIYVLIRSGQSGPSGLLIFVVGVFIAGFALAARRALSQQPTIYGDRAQLAVAAATVGIVGFPAYLLISVLFRH